MAMTAAIGSTDSDTTNAESTSNKSKFCRKRGKFWRTLRLNSCKIEYIVDLIINLI